MTALRTAIGQLAERRDLSAADAEAAFAAIMEGEASEAEIAGFLMGLRMKGETVEEIASGVRMLRARMTRVPAPAGAIDCCGTGGDAKGTYNISTAVSFVLAGAGVKVAKHGNRALSSKSGAADVLTALGIKIELPPMAIARAINEAGVGFMMAPLHHPAMKHVAKARAALGIRTIFNLMGPLANPASVKRQLVGVFSPHWVKPVAETLGRLGTEAAWVVHGQGLDELTTTGATLVAELKDGQVRTFDVTPAEAGLEPARLEDLIGGSAVENAAKLRAVLGGERGPYRDMVLLNAAAAFLIAGKTATLKDGAALAAGTIDEGRATAALDRLVKISNAP